MMHPQTSIDDDLTRELVTIEQSIQHTRVFTDNKGCRVNPLLVSLAVREEHIVAELVRRRHVGVTEDTPSLS